MEIRSLLVDSFGEEANSMLQEYPDLMQELASKIIALSKAAVNATEEQKPQIEKAMEALKVGAVASIKAQIKQDATQKIATSAVKFTLAIIAKAILKV